MNLVCDLDGVVYLGKRAVPGSAAALEELTRRHWNIVFCTNNSSRTPTDVASRVEAITGFAATSQQVVTSAQAAATLLGDTKPATLVLGGEGILEALAEVGVEMVDRAGGAEAVVVGLAVDLTYDWLREAVAAVRNGARLIATNLDPTYPTEDGLWPGGGAIVAAVETASGVKAEPAGKPWPPMQKLIESRLLPGPVWVVGDRADTDLALAEAAGWLSALVLTGVTAPDQATEPPPDLVAADLAGAVELILGYEPNHPPSAAVDTHEHDRTA